MSASAEVSVDEREAALAALATRIVEAALPGEELEVVVGESSTTSAKAFNGEVEALTIADVAGIGVRIIRGGRQGFASAGSLDRDVIDEVVAEARDNMAFAVPDPHVTLARPDGVAPMDLDTWDDELLALSTDAKVAMAIELEAAVRAGDPRISGVRSAGYGDAIGLSVLASTAGVLATSRSTVTSLGVLALAKQGEETKSGGGSTIARGPSGLDLQLAASDAVSRATALLGATQPPSARLTLVLEPRMAASLLGIIGGMLSGERVLKGRTPFADRVGEQIGHGALTLRDNPRNPDSFGARRFDGEGLAARVNPLIEDGYLQQFLHNTVSAAKSDTVSTANATRGLRSTPGVSWHALEVAPGTGSLDDIVASVDHGLLVHSMAGLHSGVNAVSGDFSVGAEGMIIRNGEVGEPVREVTIASTLPKLLMDVSAVADDVEHLPGGISTPTIAVDNVSMSGK